MQASKPCPVNVVSGQRAPARWASEAVDAGEGACVGHRVGGDDLGSRVLVGHRRRDVAGERRVVPAETTTLTGDSVEVTTRSGPRDTLGAPARQVHRLGAADEVGRAGDPARVAEVDRVSCRSARSPACPPSGARASPRGPRRPRRGRSPCASRCSRRCSTWRPRRCGRRRRTADGADTVAVARVRPSSSTVVERAERVARQSWRAGSASDARVVRGPHEAARYCPAQDEPAPSPGRSRAGSPRPARPWSSGPAANVQPFGDVHQVFLGRVGVDPAGGRPAAAGRGTGLLRLGVRRALPSLCSQRSPTFSWVCLRAANAVRWARSPSPYWSTAESCVLPQVSRALRPLTGHRGGHVLLRGQSSPPEAASRTYGRLTRCGQGQALDAPRSSHCTGPFRAGRPRPGPGRPGRRRCCDPRGRPPGARTG